MGNIPINDLSRLTPTELTELSQIFTDVCASGYFMLGPHTKSLEIQLAHLVQQPHVVCVANGTDALTLALQSLGVARDSKVITVPNAGGYTTTAALRLGALPILTDIEPSTGQMSAESLRSTLAEHPDTQVVVATHLYGLMAPMEEISIICNEFGVKLLEDCAQAIGAHLNGHPAGSWGNASTFSFYPTKNLGCLGDGGAVALRDAKDAQVLRQLAQYGWNSRYSVELSSGFNSRIDEIQAAILVHRLESLEQDNNRRRSIVARYEASLKGKRHLLWKDDPSFVGHLAIMVSNTRDSDIESLETSHIGTGVHYPITDHQQIAWKSVFAGQSSPCADMLTSQILTLPCFPKMTDSEVDAVCVALTQLS